QAGTNTAEKHPALDFSVCTSSGCTKTTQSIVIDANWRWLHTTSGYTNCYTGNTWNATICPDGVKCAANCALDGADYSGTYGIMTTGNALKLNFITMASQTNVGSRTYLMAAGSPIKYQMLKLLGQEFIFDVDVIPNSQSTVSGVTGNSLSDSWCAAQKTAFGDQNVFATKGGLKTMGDSLKKGMVLVMSVWDDHIANMLWLDAPYPPDKDAATLGVSRGMCGRDSGAPASVESVSVSASVTYSNIEWGPIGSAYTGTA
ncbi:glycoside hydrolase, partial [Acephala macrosclerotiorum]